MRNYRVSFTIRIVAGLYLLYSAYSLGKAYLTGENNSIFILIAAIAFAGFGAVFAVTGVLNLKKLSEIEAREAEEEAQKQAEEQPVQAEPDREAQRPRSISERARMTANLAEDEEEN